jgi:glutathione S-transferase
LRQPVGEISRPLFRGKAQEFAKQITDAASIVQNEFALLETRLAAGPWLTGERVSAADLVVYPVLMQLLRAVSRDDSASLDLPFRSLNDHFPKLFAWLKRLDTLPGYDNAYPPHWK